MVWIEWYRMVLCTNWLRYRGLSHLIWSRSREFRLAIEDTYFSTIYIITGVILHYYLSSNAWTMERDLRAMWELYECCVRLIIGRFSKSSQAYNWLKTGPTLAKYNLILLENLCLYAKQTQNPKVMLHVLLLFQPNNSESILKL
jgi:hypothetical protein